MGKWNLGASAKEFAELPRYAELFDWLEIDLEKTTKLGFSVDEVFDQAKQCADQVYSIHLRYKPTDEGDGIAASIRDLDDLFRNGIAEEFGVQIFVTHTDYPKNPAQLQRQMRRLSEAAENHGVTIAVENLADRGNKTKDYMEPRNPRAIAAVLEKLDSPHLGLCLDTGHAISNAGLTDSLRWDDNVSKWLRHVHYNDNTFREDAHLPISSNTSGKLIEQFEHLTAHSKHDGTIIFEHRKLTEAVLSLEYVKNREKKRTS